MLTDDEAAELAALRARAFGPDADLADDPAGLARLDDLEQRSRPDSDATPTPAADAPSVGTAPPESEHGAAATAPRTEPHTPEAAPTPPSSANAGPTHRTWTRRAVLLVGAPVVAVACAVGTGFGAAVAARSADAAPAPGTTFAPAYAASHHAVSEMHTWDEGSPRLLGDIDRSLVWEGTTANGTVTCVVVDEVFQGPISTCQATDALTTSGVGVSVADPRSEAVRTYVAWPDGAPLLTYTTDDPNPSP